MFDRNGPRRGLSACLAATMAITGALGGCATSSKDISATYISPNQYQHLDCDQLAQEARRVQVRVVELGGRLDEAAKNDQILVGVGMVLFWPALFALGGTKSTEAEFARLRGEYDALQQVGVQKKCASTVAPSAPAAASPASAPG